MLAYILALAVAIGSLAIYMAAFFFPEIHRKNDFIWSGVGLFYAFVLWVCAGRLSGGLLLGQIASVVLLGWAVIQVLQLRRQLTPAVQQTAVPSAAEMKTSVQEQVTKLSLRDRIGQIGSAFGGAKAKIQQTVTKSPTTPAPASTPTAKPVVEIIDKRTQTPVPATEEITTPTPTPVEEVTTPTPAPTTEEITTPEPQTEAVPELHRPNPPSPELVEAAIEASEEAHETAEVISQIPIEELAPEAELAPPAEAPPDVIPPTDRPGT